MVQALFRFIRREVANLHAAAYTVALLTLVAQILALLRDRIFASTFGVGQTLDLYYAAFRIPDLLFALFASLVSAYILIPLLSEAFTNGRARARELLSSAATFFVVILGIISGVVCIFVPEILNLLYPTLTQGALYEEFVLLTRILLIQPFFLGLSSILGSITQIERRFFLFALSPVLYNLGIIAGALFLYPTMGLIGLAWGVAAGAFLHMLLHVPVVMACRVFPRPTIPSFTDIKHIVIHSVPRSLALSTQTLMEVGVVVIAAPLAIGSVTVYSLANNLHNVPLALIGASYAVVAFPTLATLHAQNNTLGFLERVSSAARHLILWSMFATVLFIVLRAHIVRVVLGTGEFTWSDTRLTAAVLGLLMVSLVGQAIVLLIARAYYASGKSFLPLIIQGAGAAVSIGGALIALALFRSYEGLQYFVEALLRISYIPGTEVVAVALGVAVGQLFAGGLALFCFTLRYAGFWKNVAPVIVQSFAAAIIAGGVAYGTLFLLGGLFALSSLLSVFAQGFLAGTLGLVTFIAILALLANGEFAEIRAGIENFRKKRLEPQSDF